MLHKFKTTAVQITTYITTYIIIETSPVEAVQPGAGPAGWGLLGSPGSSTQALFVIVKVPLCDKNDILNLFFWW